MPMPCSAKTQPRASMPVTQDAMTRMRQIPRRRRHSLVRDRARARAQPREEWCRRSILTRTGALCSATRQEFILLSDTLGVSMLVDAINHRREGGGTESTVLGPFYVQGAETLPMGASIAKDGRGEPMLVSGRILDSAGRPIAGATLDVWQASPSGFYDVQDKSQPAFNLRGVFRTEADGRYWFRTVKPCSYPIPDDGPVGKCCGPWDAIRIVRRTCISCSVDRVTGPSSPTCSSPAIPISNRMLFLV